MSGLSSLVPEAVGLEASRAVALHVLRLAQKLYPDAPASVARDVLNDPKALLVTPIAMTMRQLTRYAQRGLPIAGWTGREDVERAMSSALTLLAPAVRPTEGEWSAPRLEIARRERPSALALVLFCAQHRLDLDAFEPIPISALARLGSVSDQRVHDLVSAGTLKRARRKAKDHTAYAEAKTALRWLDSRRDDPLFTDAVAELNAKLGEPMSLGFADGQGRARWLSGEWYVELQSDLNGPCSVVALKGAKGELGCGTWGLRDVYAEEEWVPLERIGETVVTFTATQSAAKAEP